jgi:predicted ATPase/class 3 adenylate cyclase
MSELPTGTVTFLFSDVEGSTRLLQELGDRYADVLADYRQLLRAAFQTAGGHEVDTAGDGVFVAFHRATDAVAVAAAAQRAIVAHPWPEGVQVRVRMGLHTGEPTLTLSGYVGLDVHRAARICAAGHGGQVLLSQTTYALVAQDLPERTSLRDLGEHRLKDLQRPERLFQLVTPALPADFPPLNTLDRHPHNLPAQPTPLIGREREVTAARDVLHRAAVRLLTLTGPGGTGKTRLGLHVAADVLDDFEDGVYFVPLAPISDPALVVSTIAQMLGVREIGGRSSLESLKDSLRDKQTLLLLDNFEQVVSAAPMVAELLAACPKLKILVTSRVALRLSGEHEFPVPPLALPDPRRLPAVEVLSQYAAVTLFIQRALAAKPDFAVTNESAPAVAEICVRLDGLPLAIELAAARVKILPPKALLARLLGATGGSLLQLLTGGPRDAPARHQTLRRTIAWSYDLLDAEEKALFRRLAVFVGGCTLDAAEALCNVAGDLELDVLEGVASLVDKSLLRQQEQAEGEPRFQMLETIREYALECLTASGEGEAARRAHADYYLALAERGEPELTGPRQVMWLNRLEAEHDNLRAALEWLGQKAEAEQSLRLGGALWRFWVVRGHLREGRERLAELLALAGASVRTEARAQVLTGAGTLAHNRGEYALARALFEESLAIWRELGHKAGIASALNNLGWMGFRLSEYAAGRSHSEEGLALYRELGDPRGIAAALNNLGWLAHHQGHYQAARAYHEGSLALRQELGDKRGIAFSLTNLGWTVHMQGDCRRARALLEEGLGLFREVGEKQLFAFTLTILAQVAQAENEDAQAMILLEESMTLFQEIGDQYGLALACSVLGNVVRAQGEYERAGALYGKSLAIRREIGDKWGVAASLYGLGRVAQDRGDDAQAKALYEESLALRWEIEDWHGIAECLEDLAGQAVVQQQLERAARLFGAATALRETIGAPLPPERRARYERDLATVRAGMGEAPFTAAMATGTTMSLEQAIAEAG